MTHWKYLEPMEFFVELCLVFTSFLVMSVTITLILMSPLMLILYPGQRLEETLLKLMNFSS